jgi:hypothetical protein
VAVGITVGIGIIEWTGAAIQNIASVAGTATTGLHAGIHSRTNKDVRETTAIGYAELSALHANCMCAAPEKPAVASHALPN